MTYSICIDTVYKERMIRSRQSHSLFFSMSTSTVSSKRLAFSFMIEKWNEKKVIFFLFVVFNLYPGNLKSISTSRLPKFENLDYYLGKFRFLKNSWKLLWFSYCRQHLIRFYNSKNITHFKIYLKKTKYDNKKIILTSL